MFYKSMCYVFFAVVSISLTTPLQILAQQNPKQIKPAHFDHSTLLLSTQLKSNRYSYHLAQAPPDESSEDDYDFDAELMEEYGEETSPADSVPDPLYYFNYAMYGLNDFLYFVVFKPVATGYKTVVPTPARRGIRNFFHNLLFPVRLVNNLLQGKVSEAGTEFEIFVINSTVGCLGFVQVAQEYYGKTTSDENLGQTFGSWSIGEGFYLVLPVLGPTTLRDSLGLVGDYFITPVNYAEPWELYWGLKATDSVNSLSFRLGDYEALKEAAINPYAAIKNAYIQNQNKKIQE